MEQLLDYDPDVNRILKLKEKIEELEKTEEQNTE